MKKITLQHVLGNKILEYDVDDRGVIIDEREKIAMLSSRIVRRN